MNQYDKPYPSAPQVQPSRDLNDVEKGFYTVPNIGSPCIELPTSEMYRTDDNRVFIRLDAVIHALRNVRC